MKAVTECYQRPKRVKAISDKYRDGSQYEGDARFYKYADMLRAGDREGCDGMRAEHTNDAEFMTRISTIERLWISQMLLYVREVQIVRRECEGYRQLAEGYLKQMEGDTTPTNFNTMIKRGRGLLKQAALAREEHEEIKVPIGFKGLTPRKVKNVH